MRELEPKLEHSSDEEVALVREKVYGMALLAYDSYKEQKGSKFSVGSTDIDDIE